MGPLILSEWSVMRQGLWRAAVPVLALGVLAGCATLGERPAAQPPASSARAARAHAPGRLLYYVLLGDIAGQQGHLGAAAQAFGWAAQATGDLGLVRRSALLSLYARRYGQARHLVRLWLSSNPQSVSARAALADAEFGLTRIAAADQGFLRALARAGTQGGAEERAFTFEHIATLLLRHKRKALAVTIMQTLASHYPKDPIGEYILAELARRDHDRTAALRAVDAALALKPHWEDAAVLKARILWAKTPRRALAFSLRFLRSNPSATRLRLDYARRLVSLRYWHRALAQFQLIAAAAPNDPRVLYAAGLIAMRSHALDLARSYLKRSLALAPTNAHDAHARLYLGEIAETEKRYARAHYYYARVGRPYRFAAMVRDGLMLLAQSAPHLAWQRLSQVTAHTPAQVVTLTLARNQVLMALGQYAKGLSLVNAVIHRVPQPDALLYARALDEERLGAAAAAERDLRRLVAAHPHNAIALNALGYTYIDNRQHERRGMILVRRALALAPHDPDILDSLGWGYYREGHMKEAVGYLKQAYARSHDPTIAAHLGAALWAFGHHARALRLWHRALIKAPDNGALKAELAKHQAL